MSYFNGITDAELLNEGWTEVQIADLRRIEKQHDEKVAEKKFAISAAQVTHDPLPWPNAIRNDQRQKRWFAFWPVTIDGETKWMRFVTVLQESKTIKRSTQNPGWPPGVNGFYTVEEKVWENIAFL